MNHSHSHGKGHHGSSHGHEHLRRHDHSGCGHAHHHPPIQAAEQALWGALLLNLFFLVVEVGVGLWSNSLALLSDAGHMLTDVAALALALVAERLSRLGMGGHYTFGWRRLPSIAAFGNALTLIAIVFMIYWESFKRLYMPPSVMGGPVLVVGVLGLCVNLGSAWWLHRSSHGSLNIRGAMLHMIADALGSLAAIVSALVILWTGWSLIDPLVSLLIGSLILIGTWPLLRDSFKVLLQVAPARMDIQAIRAKILEQPHVVALCDFHVWELHDGETIFSAILLTQESSLQTLEQTSDQMRVWLKEHWQIEHATFEWRASAEAIKRCEASTPAS